MGKQTKINQKANRELKKLFENTSIRSCEVGFDSCTGSFALSFAHRHKRNWYYSCPEKLSDFNQVLLCCISCHAVLEHDKELTERVFNAIRGKE